MSSDLIPLPVSTNGRDLKSTLWDNTPNHKGCQTLEPVTFDDGYLARLRMRDSNIQDHFDAYFRFSIRTFMRARIGRWEDIDDLTQDVLTAVLEGIYNGALREAGKLPGYIRGVSYNIALQYIKKNSRYKQQVEIDPSELSGHEASVEKVLITKQLIRGMSEAVAKLPPREREALERELSGRPREQTAIALGVKMPHLRLILCRAREHLRSLLDRR